MGSEAPDGAATASAVAADAAAVPKIVAFDLDGTLWFPEMYMLSGGAPFRRDAATGAVFDAAGERLRLLHQTLDVFTELATDERFADTEVAYVSRTEYPEWALPALKEVRA